MNVCAYCSERARTPCTCTTDCGTQKSPIGSCPRAYPIPETQTIQLNADGPLDSEMPKLLAEAIRRSREGGITRLLDGDHCIAEIVPVMKRITPTVGELVPGALADYAKQDVESTQEIYEREFEEMARYSDFHHELESLINHYSRESRSNTPDFLLATFMEHCLKGAEELIKLRDQWYGVHLEPGGSFFGSTEE